MQWIGQVDLLAEWRCSISNRRIDVVRRVFDHDGFGEAVGVESLGSLASAVVASVGEHDPLGVGSSLLVPAVDEGHVMSSPEKYNRDEPRTD